MVSTSSRAGWRAASMARRTAPMSLTTPVEVSLWTMHTALMAWSLSSFRRFSMAAGSARLAPVAAHELGLDAELVGHLLPQRGEVAGLPHQHEVARRQRVHQRRFPRAGARRRIDDHRLLGLEDLPHAAQNLLGQRIELRSAVIDGRIVHRPQDPVGDVGRPGDLQEMPAARDVSSGAWISVAPLEWRCSYCIVVCNHAKN